MAYIVVLLPYFLEVRLFMFFSLFLIVTGGFYGFKSSGYQYNCRK